jgi:hypothetical protein
MTFQTNGEHITDNQDALLDYLYEEGDASDRLTIARHLQQRAPCSAAMLELQSVRGMLKDWTPPDAELGFKIVREVEKPSWFASPLRSRWLQAAAAVILFVSGMAVSQLTLDYGDGSLIVRTRGSQGAGSGAAAAPVAAASNPSPAPANFAALEQELRSELASARLAAASSESRAADDDLLRRVQAMIEQSEVRQQRELALRLADVVRDFDTQRRADLLRVEQNFGQLENQTGAEVAQQRELLNYLVRTSGQGR